MKLVSTLSLLLCFGLTACGGGGNELLNENERGLFVGNDEHAQNLAIEDLADNRAADSVIKAECERLQALSNSGTLNRMNLLKLESDGTVRAVYYNEFGLFDPTLERIETDQDFYVLGRIVDANGKKQFLNSQPAFGKTTISNPDENTVISTDNDIQRTFVDFYSASESGVTDTVNFTTDTVGSFGIEDRAAFEYKKVNEEELDAMMFNIEINCLEK